MRLAGSCPVHHLNLRTFLCFLCALGGLLFRQISQDVLHALLLPENPIL